MDGGALITAITGMRVTSGEGGARITVVDGGARIIVLDGGARSTAASLGRLSQIDIIASEKQL